ncbi:LysR substrate-binding domain-containing protein [Comamonas sp.]|uniref:LysR substrate-binding domain-containing protein n=1 Tax=Comamonas sp. TaxID=34028 RepID=UPI002FC8ED02
MSQPLRISARIPSLTAVRYFSVAARLLSFTGAAQELHVTQAAVSRMVQTLEQDLGVALFQRSGKFIRLTPAGLAYYQEVSEALAKILQASQTARRSAQEETLSLIVNTGFAIRWLVPRLPDFQRLYPHIHVDILASEADALESQRPVHLSIRLGGQSAAGHSVTRLNVGDDFGVVCSPALLSYKKVAAPADLIGQPLLAHTNPTRDFWAEYFADVGLGSLDMGQAPRFHQLLMIAEAAISGLGFALVPLFLFQEELKSGRLVQVFTQTHRPQQGYCLVQSKESEKDHKVNGFKQWLLKTAETNMPSS